jgi:multiple sugar transport system permease protein
MTATLAQPHTYRRRQRLEWVALHSFAVALGLLFVLPFVFLVLTAVMSDQQSLTRDTVAADHPPGVRRRVLDLPAAAVHAHGAADLPRGREDRRLR